MVWKYFKVDEKDENYAICTIRGCGQRISQGLPHGTTPLLRHLASSKHRITKDGPSVERGEPKQTKLQLPKTISWNSRPYNEMCNSLVLWIAAAGHPFQFVNDASFCLFCTKHNPACPVPQRKAVAARAAKLCERAVEYLLHSYLLGRCGMLCLC